MGKDIKTLGFTVRVDNALRKHGINTVEELASLSMRQLGVVRKLGAKGLAEIKEKCEKAGIRIKQLFKGLYNECLFDEIDIEEIARTPKVIFKARIKSDFDIKV